MEDQILYQFSRGTNETVQFTLREYKQRKYIDLRIFFKPENEDVIRPTKKGITLGVDLFPELKKAMSICEKKLTTRQF